MKPQGDSATALRRPLEPAAGEAQVATIQPLDPPDSFVMLRDHQKAAGCTDVHACGVCVALARAWLYDEAERQWS